MEYKPESVGALKYNNYQIWRFAYMRCHVFLSWSSFTLKSFTKDMQDKSIIIQKKSFNNDTLYWCYKNLHSNRFYVLYLIFNRTVYLLFLSQVCHCSFVFLFISTDWSTTFIIQCLCLSVFFLTLDSTGFQKTLVMFNFFFFLQCTKWKLFCLHRYNFSGEHADKWPCPRPR